MDSSQFLQRLVVGIEREVAAPQVGVEMLHPPDGSLHLQQERSVVGLILLKLPTGVRDYAVLPLLVDLGQNSPQTTRLLAVPQTGVRDEGVGPVVPRVVHHRLGAQVGLELQKCLVGIFRQRAPFPTAVFPC